MITSFLAAVIVFFAVLGIVIGAVLLFIIFMGGLMMGFRVVLDIIANIFSK